MSAFLFLIRKCYFTGRLPDNKGAYGNEGSTSHGTASWQVWVMTDKHHERADTPTHTRASEFFFSFIFYLFLYFGSFYCFRLLYIPWMNLEKKNCLTHWIPISAMKPSELLCGKGKGKGGTVWWQGDRSHQCWWSRSISQRQKTQGVDQWTLLCWAHSSLSARSLFEIFFCLGPM